MLNSLTLLTTNDDYSCYRNLVACYRLAQSILKIGSALTERVGQGEVGGRHPEGESAWLLLQLAVESPDQYQVGHLSAFLQKKA